MLARAAQAVNPHSIWV